MTRIVGIDEVGRGPLAGPVTVGVFVIEQSKHTKLKKIFSDARDSKKLSPKKREEIFHRVKEYTKTNSLRYIVVNQSSTVIDKFGITSAIQKCIEMAFRKMKLDPKQTKVFLDGGLKAPREFTFQETIIKGDDKVLVISLASIMAKVSRDNLMKKLDKKHPGYGFGVHKGYGTKLHKEMIKKLGASPVHRRTWIKG